MEKKWTEKNSYWLFFDPDQVPIVMFTKFPATVMVLGNISIEGDIMASLLLEADLEVNIDACLNILPTVVNPWMDGVHRWPH